MTNSKIFIQNTTKMIHLKKYIRKVNHAAPILYFVWQFCLNQWELIQYNLSFPFYWSRTYLSHQTSHRNVSGPQIFPLSQPYKFSDSMWSYDDEGQANTKLWICMYVNLGVWLIGCIILAIDNILSDNELWWQ